MRMSLSPPLRTFVTDRVRVPRMPVPVSIRRGMLTGLFTWDAAGFGVSKVSIRTGAADAMLGVSARVNAHRATTSRSDILVNMLHLPGSTGVAEPGGISAYG